MCPLFRLVGSRGDVHHEHFEGPRIRDDLKPKLIANSRNGRLWILRIPINREIEESVKVGFVDNGSANEATDGVFL